MKHNTSIKLEREIETNMITNFLYVRIIDKKLLQYVSYSIQKPRLYE